MKLKKGLAVALTATMAFGALTGCSNNGGNNETTAGTVSQAESTPVAESTSAAETTSSTTTDNTGIESCTIEFWHAMNNKQEEELKALTDKFNAENEYGITVNLTAYS